MEKIHEGGLEKNCNRNLDRCMCGAAYATREEARRDIFAHIEGFYNRTRRHSAIGYISSIEMELKAA